MKQDLRKNIEAVLDSCFSETKDENKKAALDNICKLITKDQSNPNINWITPAEGREHTFNKLYLAFQPGYPMMIADWKTGHGYRDVRTGVSIQPTLVAYIDLPKVDYE